MKQFTRIHSRRAALAAGAALFAVCFLFGAAFGQTITINKSNNAPAAGVQSGVPFTYYIGYNWSGPISGGTLVVQDIVPSPLIIQSTSPTGASVVISGNTVTLTDNTCTAPSGSHVLGITVYFPYGTTCPQTMACDTARVKIPGTNTPAVVSNVSCATALAKDNWTFQNQYYAGCACGQGNDVIFRVVINSPISPIGSLDMTSATLNYSFPFSGATITGVTMGGSIVGNCTYGWDATISPSNTATIKLCTSDYSVWNYWQTIYIHVSFPCSDTGKTMQGVASWVYQDTCSPKQFTFRDTASVTICKAVSGGSLYKYFYQTTYVPNNPFFYPNKITPGCCGTYAIQYGNTGSVSQTNVVMTDTVPGNMDVSDINVSLPAGMTAVTVKVWQYPSAIPVTFGSYVTSTTITSAMLAASLPVSKIEWDYTGTLGVASYIVNTFDVCVRKINFRTLATVSPGDLIRDTVSVTSSSAVGPVTDTYIAIDTVSAPSPHLVAEKSFVGSCTKGPNGPWYPGDIARYEIAVANLGSSTSLTNIIKDQLPPGFTYEGNETYYWGNLTPPNTWLQATAPPCTSFGPYTTGMQTDLGPLVSPLPGATNCQWSFPNLPSECDGTPKFFIIQFDVLIDTLPPTLPGTYCNAFTIAASNAATALSDSACMVVSSIAKVSAVKQVRSGTSGAWGSTASIPPGGTGQFLLTVTNTGNQSISNLCILDILPHTGDIGVLPPYTPRNSAFNLPLTTTLTSILPAGFTASYYNGNPGTLAGTSNPKRSAVCNGFCSAADPPGSTTGIWNTSPPTWGTYSFTVSAGSTVLAPGASLQVIVPFTMPANATFDSVACNSFAYQCNPTGDSGICLAAEPPNVCVTVGKDTVPPATGGCCDTAYYQPYPFSPGQVDWRTITVVNLEGMPISYIEIQYFDCSSGSPGTLITNPTYWPPSGGGLIEWRSALDNVQLHTPPSGIPPPDDWFRPKYNRVPDYEGPFPAPISGSFPSALPAWAKPSITYPPIPSTDCSNGGNHMQKEVMFNIGFNYYFNVDNFFPKTWCVHLIIHHCDSSICKWTMPSWTWGPGDSIKGGVTPVKADTNIRVISLLVNANKFPEAAGGYLLVTPADSTDKIIGGSGEAWPSLLDASEHPGVNTFKQAKRGALFSIDAGSSSQPINVFIAVSGNGKREPKVNIYLTDPTGHILSADTATASTAVSRVDPPVFNPGSNDIAITGVVPNPATNSVTFTYSLGANESAHLELFNTLGQSVGVLADEFQTQGEHQITYNVVALPEGTYFLRLSNRFGKVSAIVKVIH